MEYEFDSLTELPPLPQVYDPMDSESLPPLPSSDFITPPFFLDSPLSLLTRHHISESTQFENLFNAAFSDEATPFLHLPDLNSFETDVVENNKPPFLTLSPPVEKTKPLFLSLSPPVENKRRRFTHSPSSSSNSGSPARASTYPMDATRRKKISDKIRSLEKLMPWEKKMSLATILEETHKYITFLQSQIASFWWMPLDSNFSTTITTGDGKDAELLKSLTRQQILQVIANSPGARTQLYARGVCVFSYEQLLSLKMMSQSARNL